VYDEKKSTYPWYGVYNGKIFVPSSSTLACNCLIVRQDELDIFSTVLSALAFQSYRNYRAKQSLPLLPSRSWERHDSQTISAPNEMHQATPFVVAKACVPVMNLS
jgi:hypothetical protein